MVNYALLKTAADDSGDRELARQAPRLLEEGINAAGRRYLVMSVAQATGETRAFTPGHERFLASLGKTRFRSTDFEVSGCSERLRGSLARLEGRVSGKTLATLHQAYHDCETALVYWTGPYVLSQGDFAPWNIRSLGSQVFVFDWGSARTEASPLEDVLHYMLIQPALHRLALTARLLQSAMKRAQDFALLAYPEWRWRPRVIGALTLVYLLGALLHHSQREQRLDYSDPVVKSYWKLIEKRSAWMPGSN